MAVRTDIQVLPVYSPRIVLVEAPSVEVTIQDLYDTLRAWEDSEEAHSYELPIIDAGGKEDLGGGVSVGVSATLQNAQLMFQARTVPVETGTVTTADPTGRVLTDSVADFVAAGLIRGDLVQNLTSGAKATVLTVATTELGVLFLEGGDDARFDLTDSYEAYHLHVCNISGGNLVAIDDVGGGINSTLASFGVNIVRTSSASATLQDLDAIQYASYQNAVWVDVTGSTEGTAYPAGTREFPVNNLTDAQAIAIEKGFSTLQLLSNTIINTGLDLRGFEFVGKSHVATHLMIESAALVEDITISNCNVSGVLDGGTHIVNCMVGDLTYVNGHIHASGLYGLILLDGDEDAVIVGCYTIDADSPPVIDMGGGGQDLAMPNYSGLVSIRNLSDPTDEIGVGLQAGLVVLEDTITAGTVIVSGVGILEDHSIGSPPDLVINTDGLLNKKTLTEITWNTVHVDTVHGTAGTDFPLGTRGRPVSNMTDARTIALREGFDRFECSGALTLTGSCDGCTFIANNPDLCSIDLNGQDVTGSTFRNVAIVGDGVGHIDGLDCYFPNGYDGLNCHLENCIMAGTFVAVAGEAVNADRCTFAAGAIFDLNGTGSVNLANASGIVTVINATDPGCFVGITGTLVLTLHSSVTAGTGFVGGMGILVDMSGAGFNLTERMMPSSVWNELAIAHATNGTVGAALRDTGDHVRGEWELDAAANQIVYYRQDGSELARFNTFNAAGNPATAGVVRRVPV